MNILKNKAFYYAGMKKLETNPSFPIESIGLRLDALITDFITTPLKKAFNFGEPLTMAELWGTRKIANMNKEEKHFLNGMYRQNENSFYSEFLAERRTNDFIEKMSYDILEKYQDQMDKNPKLAEKIKGAILNDKINIRKNRLYFNLAIDDRNHYELNDLENTGEKEEIIKHCFSKIEAVTGQKVCWDYELKAPYLIGSYNKRDFYKDKELSDLISESFKNIRKDFDSIRHEIYNLSPCEKDFDLRKHLNIYDIDSYNTETLINKLTVFSTEKSYQCSYRIMSDRLNDGKEEKKPNPIEKKMVSAIDKASILTCKEKGTFTTFSDEKDVAKIFDEHLSNKILEFSEWYAEWNAMQNGEIAREKNFKYENAFSNENDLKKALLAVNEKKYEKWKTIKHRLENYSDYSLTKEAFVHFEKQKNEHLAKDPEYAKAYNQMKKLKDEFNQYLDVVMHDDFHKLNEVKVFNKYDQIEALQKNENLMHFDRGEWKQLQERSEVVTRPFVEEYMDKCMEKEAQANATQTAEQEPNLVLVQEETVQSISTEENTVKKGRGR